MIPDVCYASDLGDSWALLESNELEENLVLARKICDYVNSVILFSSNVPKKPNSKKVQAFLGKFQELQANPENNEILRDVRYRLESLHELVRMSRAEISEFKERTGLSSQALKVIYQRAMIAQRYGIGNCLEKACYAFFVLTKSEKKVPKRVEIFYIGGGDHAFLVIGRKRGSDETNPLDWGPEAVVCDPWAWEEVAEDVGNVYPASEIPIRLRNYLFLQIDDEGVVADPQLNAFDPQIHTLRQYAEYPGDLTLAQRCFQVFTDRFSKQAAPNDSSGARAQVLSEEPRSGRRKLVSVDNNAAEEAAKAVRASPQDNDSNK